MADPVYGSPDIARRAATPMGSPVAITAGPEISLDNFAKNIANGSDQQRLALAQNLKDAGFWKGKISSKFNIKYYGALIKLEEQYQGQVALNKLVGTTAPTNRLNVLTDILAGNSSNEQGSSGPTTTKQTYITSASQTAKLLNSVAKDLLERDLTKAEQAKYLKMINLEQRRQPSVQTSGKGFNTTQGGIDEGQFITDKLQATGEAKTVRATDAYTIMMQEFGGLR